MRRRAFLAAIVAPPGPLGRGRDYLWHRQGADGGWHSETYGLLRSGQSLTPLIVNALLDAGVNPANGRIQRALEFLAIIALQPSGDYPCYAAALTLRALVRTFGRKHSLVPKLIAWLRTQQMSPANGWHPAAPAFGAWGIGGAPRPAPNAGHIDISMTRHVLEALAEAGVSPEDESLRGAGYFVNRCRNSDGGFFFSTTETAANKAGESSNGYGSYATATADGLLCQIAMADPAAAQTLKWLRAHDHPELPQGFPNEARGRYAEGLRYYYADAATRAFRAAGASREVQFAAVLASAQRSDGSWRNAEPLVKEDDPLIATAFAVSALAQS